MDAKLNIRSLRGSRTGVYVGCMFSDYLSRASKNEDLSGYEIVNGLKCMHANKISYFYDFKVNIFHQLITKMIFN